LLSAGDVTGGEIATRSAKELAGTIIEFVPTTPNAHELALFNRHTRIVLPKGEGNMTPDKRVFDPIAFDSH
jgi:hypothetical protein